MRLGAWGCTEILPVVAALYLPNVPALADKKQDFLNRKFEKEIEIRKEQAYSTERFARLQAKIENLRLEI
jgi:hypothetical protein